MTAPAATAQMTLDEVCARLARHPQVTGLLLIGSAQRADVPAYADYDLVIVLADNPLRLHVGVTTIDGRLADLIFVTRPDVHAILNASRPLDPGVWVGRLAAWLSEGTIRFDRHGELAAAQQTVKAAALLRPRDETDVTQAHFALNYNLAQTTRLLTSDDPVYQLAAQVRLHWFGASDLLTHYLTIRRKPWRGEKAAIRYVQATDPDYLARYQRFLSTGDANAKFALYRQLAAEAAAPAGGLWPENVTSFQLERNADGPLPITAAEALWATLIRGE